MLLGNMPLIPIDYSKTHFYKIICNDLNISDCYVGHTIDFRKRKNHHKTTCNNEKDEKHNLKLYQFIRENGGWNNWQMINIETLSCKDSLEAKAIERQFAEQLKATLNTIRPTSTKEEQNQLKKKWYEDHKEEQLTKQKERYEENKEVILERNKKWRDEHQEEQKEYHKNYRENNKEKVAETKKKCYENKKEEYLQNKKEYYQNHKEELNIKRKERYERQKDEISAKGREKVTCECGDVICKSTLHKHLKTKRHTVNLKQQQEI